MLVVDPAPGLYGNFRKIKRNTLLESLPTLNFCQEPFTVQGICTSGRIMVTFTNFQAVKFGSKVFFLCTFHVKINK